jgi:hypothetical protein
MSISKNFNSKIRNFETSMNFNMEKFKKILNYEASLEEIEESVKKLIEIERDLTIDNTGGIYFSIKTGVVPYDQLLPRLQILEQWQGKIVNVYTHAIQNRYDKYDNFIRWVTGKPNAISNPEVLEALGKIMLARRLMPSVSILKQYKPSKLKKYFLEKKIHDTFNLIREKNIPAGPNSFVANGKLPYPENIINIRDLQHNLMFSNYLLPYEMTQHLNQLLNAISSSPDYQSYYKKLEKNSNKFIFKFLEKYNLLEDVPERSKCVGCHLSLEIGFSFIRHVYPSSKNKYNLLAITMYEDVAKINFHQMSSQLDVKKTYRHDIFYNIFMATAIEKSIEYGRNLLILMDIKPGTMANPKAGHQIMSIFRTYRKKNRRELVVYDSNEEYGKRIFYPDPKLDVLLKNYKNKMAKLIEENFSDKVFLSDSCDMRLQQKGEEFATKKRISPSGYCQSWSLLMLMFAAAFPDKSLSEIATDIYDASKEEWGGSPLRQFIQRVSYNLNKSPIFNTLPLSSGHNVCCTELVCVGNSCKHARYNHTAII